MEEEEEHTEMGLTNEMYDLLSRGFRGCSKPLINFDRSVRGQVFCVCLLQCMMVLKIMGK